MLPSSEYLVGPSIASTTLHWRCTTLKTVRKGPRLAARVLACGPVTAYVAFVLAV
jgi:hypothetical protein